MHPTEAVFGQLQGYLSCTEGGPCGRDLFLARLGRLEGLKDSFAGAFKFFGGTLLLPDAWLQPNRHENSAHVKMHNLPGRPHRLAWPRTPPFHGGDRGSNPLGDANKTLGSSTVYPSEPAEAASHQALLANARIVLSV